MKQAKVKLPSGEYLIVNAPFYTKETMAEFNKNWQLLGADPTALTEEEAGEIVDKIYQYEKKGIKWVIKEFIGYKDYEEVAWICDTPTASLDSLTESLRISKPYVVLKNVEK